MFCKSLLVLFLLAIVLSVLLRYTDSDYPFGIFKLFFAFSHLLFMYICIYIIIHFFLQQLFVILAARMEPIYLKLDLLAFQLFVFFVTVWEM